MNFERGQNPKETMQIGKIPQSIKISGVRLKPVIFDTNFKLPMVLNGMQVPKYQAMIILQQISKGYFERKIYDDEYPGECDKPEDIIWYGCTFTPEKLYRPPYNELYKKNPYPRRNSLNLKDIAGKCLYYEGILYDIPKDIKIISY